MVRPPWQSSLTAAGERRRITLLLDGEYVVVDLLGNSTMAIVQSRHRARDLRHGDILWIKAMGSDDSVTDAQFFVEGLPGATRGLERVTVVEIGKGQALETSAREIGTSLMQLLREHDDRELPWLFGPHLLLLDLFERDNETFEALRTENVRLIRRMLERCLTLRDRTGRRNPHSKVLGVKSSQRRLRAMSARRMRTGQNALVQSVTLNTLMSAIRALVTEIRVEVESKLEANTWSVHGQHGRWLKAFANKLVNWMQELEHVDMHPFRKDAMAVLDLFIVTSTRVTNAIKYRDDAPLIDAEAKLREAVTLLKRIEARFEVADALRVVGTARDERVKHLGLSIKEPIWAQIEEAARTAQHTWQMTAPLQIPVRRPGAYYDLLRNVAHYYDNASRAAA